MNVGRLSKSAPKLSRICDGFRQPRRKNQNAAAISEYSDQPEYPPIQSLSGKEQRRRKKEAWHDQVTQLPTVEQKFMELNMPKYYGYRSCQLRDAWHNLNAVPFVQYATRTHLANGLPGNYYHDVKEEADEVASRIQDDVGGLIDLHFNSRVIRKNVGKDATTENFLLGLHRIMNAALAPTVEHIKESFVDVRPRVEAFWIVGGFDPDKALKKSRRNYAPTKDFENDPIDRSMQSVSTPAIGVRGDLGLPEVVALDDPLATSGSIPVDILDPRAYGLKFKHKHAVTTTGFWPGESKEHCRLWLHANGCIGRSCDIYGFKHYHDYLHQKMIISSFTQAFAHASYLGFGPVTELTYPIVQQSALSDGQKWNFSVYQLNTCALHSERAKENPVNNVLWLNDEQYLFEAVDDTGVKGFNSEVLSNLVAMYLKKGIERENATPYLSSYKYLAHHPAPEEYREDFHKFLLQYIYSGRPKHLMKPEMYLWEKIYKVDHNTRAYEPPRRFFEDHYAKKMPGNRRLDDYSPIYIPKALRKEKFVKYKPILDTEHLYTYDKK